MTDITLTHDYNGSKIQQRWSDEYVDLTSLAQSEGKSLADYSRLKSTTEYIKALSADMGIPISELFQINQGNGGHTFGHPEIAIDVAKWVSIPCRIWANRTLTEVIRSQKSVKQNSEWIESRKEGKKQRRIETDTISLFVDYATAQGSKSANKYFINISRMENNALFFVEQKYPNLRDVLGVFQLNTIQTADRIVAKALKDGMDQRLQYKDIYKLAKKRVLEYAELVGQTEVPSDLRLKESPEKYLAMV